MRGLIPRCIEQIGKYKSTLEAQGWEYTMEVTFVEIYNETIRDLLRPPAKKGAPPAAKVVHDIRTQRDGQLYISDVTKHSVEPTDTSSIDSILELAQVELVQRVHATQVEIDTVEAQGMLFTHPVQQCRIQTTPEEIADMHLEPRDIRWRAAHLVQVQRTQAQARATAICCRHCGGYLFSRFEGSDSPTVDFFAGALGHIHPFGIQVIGLGLPGTIVGAIQGAAIVHAGTGNPRTFFPLGGRIGHGQGGPRYSAHAQ